MFGLKWHAIIKGLAFMSHQVGSFLGAFGGGVPYDALGSTMAWCIGVAFALIRPSQPPVLRTA
jgi:predicted MFS family arabinose efflux permease